ncbi:transcription antitermination factor NusB [Nigerium massiliense]|uniref:transcription antitermination factor NusB n=1 Tax=Nigerium massiliense TaxID=1522317 RepID=UPI0009077F7A|nr:transcription antitermination factor NusB [Nigerium massiliense]
MADQRHHYGTRTKARKRALDILFEADLRDDEAIGTLAARVAAGEPPVRPFTSEIVEGVAADREEIDRIIAESLSAGWSLERMPRVDRNLARIAVYEMFFTDLAPEIAVNEAVGLARELSTDDSPSFLNGVLGKALATLRETYPLGGRRTGDGPEEDDAADDPEAGDDWDDPVQPAP